MSLLACADPTPTDSLWWRLVFKPDSAGIQTAAWPTPPRQRSDLSPDQWAGTYSLIMMPTVGPDRGDTIRAALEITKAKRSGNIRESIVGHAKPVKRWPWYFSFAAESLRGSALRVDVDVLYDRDDGEISMVLGNPGILTTDSGVILEVFVFDQSRFVGRWVDGGLVVFGDSTHDPEIHPQGFFCLSRVRV